MDSVANLMTNKVVLVIVIILALIGVYNVIKYVISMFSSSKSSGFQTLPYNNLNTGNQNPLWYLGNAYAGAGGSIDVPTSTVQRALFDPSLRIGHRVPVKYISASGEVSIYRGNGKCRLEEKEDTERDDAGGTKFYCTLRNPVIAGTPQYPGVENMVYNNLDALVKPNKDKLPVPYNDNTLKGINIQKYVNNDVKTHTA
ncbi:MAG TPA: hypothetical protein VFQ26_07850 [Nitrospiraceae bacterium]|nr:hypothetical protein [Nitrospiraceae bacterium]